MRLLQCPFAGCSLPCAKEYYGTANSSILHPFDNVTVSYASLHRDPVGSCLQCVWCRRCTLRAAPCTQGTGRNSECNRERPSSRASDSLRAPLSTALQHLYKLQPPHGPVCGTRNRSRSPGSPPAYNGNLTPEPAGRTQAGS